MTRFTTAEITAIQTYAAANPTMKVRTLARNLFENRGGIGEALINRTQASIYGQARKLVGDLVTA